MGFELGVLFTVLLEKSGTSTAMHNKWNGMHLYN
jgi:hypothetical protein